MTRHRSPQETHWPTGTIFTVGHSTLPIERFISLLQTYGIERLADVRTVPRSPHNPQFNAGELGNLHNIDYVPLPALGGLRHGHKDSINTGWRNESFRGYAGLMYISPARQRSARFDFTQESRTTELVMKAPFAWGPFRAASSTTARARQ